MGLLDTFKPTLLAKKEKPESLFEAIESLHLYNMEDIEKFPLSLWEPVAKGQYIDSPNYHFTYGSDISDSDFNEVKFIFNNINKLILYSPNLSKKIPRTISMQVSEIIFRKINPNYGYSGITFRPYLSNRGDISKHPLSITYMTDLSLKERTTHGELVYSLDGSLFTGTVNIWNRGNGFFYEIRSEFEKPYIWLIKHSRSNSLDCKPNIIYECEQLIQDKQFKEREHEIYDWLQKNLPDICPKSYTAFRRMKNSKSKNYQKLEAAANNLGYNINL